MGDVGLVRQKREALRPLTAEDVLLLVEVADRSVSHDRERKIPLYARCGVVESGLIDLKAKRVEIYREPSPDGYRTLRVRGERDRLAPLALPGVEIALGEIGWA